MFVRSIPEFAAQLEVELHEILMLLRTELRVPADIDEHYVISDYFCSLFVVMGFCVCVLRDLSFPVRKTPFFAAAPRFVFVYTLRYTCTLRTVRFGFFVFVVDCCNQGRFLLFSAFLGIDYSASSYWTIFSGI